MINQVSQNRINQLNNSVQNKQNTKNASQGSFQDILNSQVQEKATQSINFSKHAMARADERGIELTDDLMDKLTDTVEKASEKGATNILAFDNSQAFIINVPHYRVITTMTQEEMKENVFTNIDGAVIL